MIAQRHTRTQNLDLALIGNSCAAALVDRNARIVWWCFPHFDSDPVFSRLLAGDEEKGFTDVVLAGLAESQSGYLRNTAIVETVLTDAGGAKLRVTDFAPRFERYDGRSSRRKSSGSNRSPACRASPPSDSSPGTYIRTPGELWGNLPHSYAWPAS